MKKTYAMLATVVTGTIASLDADTVFAWGSEYPEDPATVSGLENRSRKGHNWITSEAIVILQERNLLREEIDSTDAKQLILYGNDFADNPWMGRPEAPYEPVYNHMTRHMTTLKTRHGRMHLAIPKNNPGNGFIFDSASQKSPFGGQDIRAEARVKLDFGWGRGRPNVAMNFQIAINGEFESWGQDNLHHYAYGDLRYIDPNLSADETALRLYPLFPHHLDDNWSSIPLASLREEYVQDVVVKRLNGFPIIAGAEFGAATYGSILYQLARQFFERSHAEPRLEHLVHAGVAPGFRAGSVPGASPFRDVKVDFPSTYLGGMPYICAGSSRLDSCSDGSPTWPIWVPETYEHDRSPESANVISFLDALVHPRPGRSNRAALMYLGWALHMLQDLAMPHHAANWTGKEHQTIDGYGNDIHAIGDVWMCNGHAQTVWPLFCDVFEAVDVHDYMREGLDQVLGPISEPWSREQICRRAELDDYDVVPHELNWESALQPFVSVMTHAFENRVDKMPGVHESAPYIRNAVHASALLIACAPASTLSPALIVASVSPTMQ